MKAYMRDNVIESRRKILILWNMWCYKKPVEFKPVSLEVKKINKLMNEAYTFSDDDYQEPQKAFIG